MTSRAWRSAAVLTSVAIASAVLAATRALAGPAPAGHPVPGRARDGSPAVARPVIPPTLGGVAAPAVGPVSGLISGASGPAALPTGSVIGVIVGGVSVPAADPVTRPIIGSSIGPVIGSAAGPVAGMATGPVAGPGAAPDPAGPFRWPLDGRPRVVVAFDPPAKPWLPGHRGVDLAATPGQLGYAAGPGTVAFAGRVAGVGVVSIDHAGGLRTTYEPVDATVHAGDPVAAGTPIGRIGARIAGCPAAEAACLHWGLRRGDIYLDPLALLGLGRVRLLP